MSGQQRASPAVLIVDDSLTVRMDLAAAFEGDGFRPVVCASADEMRRALGEESVSLVVLDVLLPDGDGLELLRELKTGATTGALPVLLLSTEAEVKNRVLGLQTGADEYVGKPYELSYVLARARELVRARHAPEVVERRPVLVIDDSATFREALRHALEGAGHPVLTASSGEEGLRSAAVNRPSAVLVDEMMPGIDGSTVIRRLRFDEALRGTPCVLLTASADDGAELRALEAGADAFIRKEDDADVILARLSAVLRRTLEADRASASVLGPKRILAVDDSLTYLEELAATLRSEGYDVVLARSGEEALQLLSVQSVDCVLLDMLMPGLDGHETCRRIKASSAVRDLPLIMMTAHDTRSAMFSSLSSGADDFIPKSSDFEVLKARVRTQLRRKQFENEHRRVRDELLRSELRASEERSARMLAEAKAALVEELEKKNRELESFSYSVSHDLRAPLRSIDGFAQAVLEDHGERLDERARGHLQYVVSSAKRMTELIDALLELSRVGRKPLERARVDLSAVAMSVFDELRRRDPRRQVEVVVEPGLAADADRALLRVVFDNLLGNAWKFTSKRSSARIEVAGVPNQSAPTWCVRDNGAGFEMEFIHKLFGAFQRLHHQNEFPGTGIGLATVARIVDRHGGRVWAEAEAGRGATFFFTLGASS